MILYRAVVAANSKLESDLFRELLQVSNVLYIMCFSSINYLLLCINVYNEYDDCKDNSTNDQEESGDDVVKTH